jgi:hypothetical protein
LARVGKNSKHAWAVSIRPSRVNIPSSFSRS